MMPPPPPPPPPRPRQQQQQQRTNGGAPPSQPPTPYGSQQAQFPPPPPPQARGAVRVQAPPAYTATHQQTSTATFAPPPPMVQQEQNQPPRATSSSASSSFAPIPAWPKVYEPYGEVSASVATPSGGLAHRRTSANDATATTPPRSYGGYGEGMATTYAVPPKRPSAAAVSGFSKDNKYRHNITITCFLVPTLLSILWWHESPIIMQVFMFYGLFLYAMDLMNTRDGLAITLWVGAPIMTMVSGFATLLQAEDAEATGGAMILYLVQLAVEGVFFLCISCWGTLQFQWLYKETPSIAIGVERALHSVLPPVSASILTYHLVRLLMDYWGLDRVSTLAPHIFSFLLATGMLFVSSRPTSFDPLPTEAQSQPKHHHHHRSSGTDRHSTQPTVTPSGLSASTDSAFVITSFSARFHSMVLLLVPGCMQIAMFRRRILSRYASFDELFDLILVWTVPYLLHYGILMVSETSSPYTMSTKSKLFPKQGQTTLRGTIFPMTMSLACSMALQQRYLVPLCHAVSYQFNGHDLPSTFVVTAYLTVSTLLGLFALWIYGRTSSVTNEVLFGEYHEDVVQLCVSVGGLCLGKAFGIPWNLTPLPILAFLGLSVWVTTHMMRYLCIFLFVVHAAGVVLFSYRFAAIDTVIPLAMPGFQLGLVRFGMTGVMSSVMIGLVAGFVVRPAGGFGASFLRRVDVAGMLAILYSVVLVTLELTLLKRPLPNQELSGKESDVGAQDEDYVYDHATALLTGVLMIGVSVLSQRLNVISSKSAIVTLSMAVGKAVAVLIDANEVDGKTDLSEARVEAKSERLFFRAMVASLLLIVMASPQAVLKPIHIKSTARYKRSISSGRPLAEIPRDAYLKIIIYSLVILPVTLIATIPYVLTPLAKTLSAHYGGGAYYRMAPPISAMFGFALALWGISNLSMLNHYLPDGGGEKWKKASALTLLMGLGVALSAPTVPEFLSGESSMGLSSPYASISSLGTRIISQRNRTGGWGILSASLATLLAVTGPLELKERRPPSGRKDKFLLLRLMLFSVLFGSGVSWFITIQSMSREHILITTVTAIGCMVISFFGTVTSVLGYHLELENFDEVNQIARVWIGAFVIFGFITSAPQFMLKRIPVHAFGVGGWLSTYLIVGCFVTLALASVLRARAAKNQATRKLGNLSCVMSWAFAMFVLYGQFGVAGLDDAFAVTTIVGVPASIVGTFVVAPLLLALQGEEVNERRGRVSRLSASNAKAPTKSMGLTFQRLKPSNRLVPLVAGTGLVFVLATLYTILLRGSFLFGGSRIAKSHVDVFANVFDNKHGDDLAKMAERAISHSQALTISARLAGSGFWTADNVFGPLLHLGGLVAALPSLYLLISQQWYGTSLSKATITLALPLNVIPILLCKGIPSLRAVAVIGTLGGVYQLFCIKRNDKLSQMRI